MQATKQIDEEEIDQLEEKLLISKQIERQSPQSYQKLDAETEIRIIDDTEEMISQYITEYNNLTHEDLTMFRNIPSDRYLTNSEIKERLATIDICNYAQIKNILDALIKGIGAHFKEYIQMFSGHDYKKTLRTLVLYFICIQKYIQNDHQLYSLGDSLNKFNFVWNTSNPSHHITSIPFSGSIFNSGGEMYDYIVTINPKNFQKISESYMQLYNNNAKFKNMYDDLVDGKKIIITDVMESAKGFITLMYIIKNIARAKSHKINYQNLTYLALCVTDHTIVRILKNIERFRYMCPRRLPHLIFSPECPTEYFMFSEFDDAGYSRCAPRYSVNQWSQAPADVWTVGKIKNYYLCNFHQLLIMLQLSCFSLFFLHHQSKFQDTYQIDSNDYLDKIHISTIKMLDDTVINDYVKQRISKFSDEWFEAFIKF